VTEERRQAHESALFWDLVEGVSLDPTWRRRLFDAEVGRRFPLSEEDILRLPARLRGRIEADRLRFACFNEGWTEDGFVVFGIGSVEFPDIVAYSTSNPGIV
jgi:hypothetical protein